MTLKFSRKQNRALKLLSSFESLREVQASCDFEIKVESEVFRAHRSLLIASSEFFKAMLKSDMKEKIEGEVELKGFKAKEVINCLEYLYSGEIKLSFSTIYGTLEASSYLQIDEVTDICFEFLRSEISVENCLKIHSTAKKYNHDDGINDSEEFISTNFENVIETIDHQLLSKDEMLFFLDNAADASSQISWRAISNWIHHNKLERSSNMLELLTSMPEFDLSTAVQFTLKDKLVSEDDACLEYVVTSVIFENLESLETHITVENCFTMKSWSDRYNIQSKSTELKAKIFDFMNANFKEVSEHEEFLGLSKDELIAFLVSENNKQQNEVLRWKAILKWVGIGEESRKKEFSNFFKLLNLKRLSPKFIQNDMRTNSFVLASVECKDLITDALFFHSQTDVWEYESSAIYDESNGTIYAYDANEYEWKMVLRNPALIGGTALSVNGAGYLLIFPALYKFERDCNVSPMLSYSGRHRKNIDAAVAFQNCIYLFMGNVELKFDTIRNQWTDKRLNFVVQKATAVCSTNQNIFFIGGGPQGRNCVRYDPIRGETGNVSSLQISTKVIKCAAFGHSLFVIGSNSDGNCPSGTEFQSYDYLANRWVGISLPPNFTKVLSCAAVNGRLCVAGFKNTQILDNGVSRSATICVIASLEFGSWKCISCHNIPHPQLVGLKMQFPR